MVQINDDFYEDLTPESIVTLLKALQANPGDDKGVLKIPSPGPMSGRKTCENIAGLTNLTSEPWSTEVFRKDL
jgi:NADH dehydrogenase (ubiquinone) flavoprotein 2